MEYKLVSQLERVLPKGMKIPNEIKLLYQWIEDNGLYIDIDGRRWGELYPEKALKNSWTETEREGGTIIYFVAGEAQNLKYWFAGQEIEEVKNRLCVFAQSGGEGSECAFWMTEKNEVKIVHMGSGSGSCLSCVLADKAVDFLRLLAIGYDEICWDDNFPYPPNTNTEELIVKPNEKFQDWVKSTFKVEIPKTALEIVKYPATMNDDSSEDEFFNWYQKFLK